MRQFKLLQKLLLLHEKKVFISVENSYLSWFNGRGNERCNKKFVTFLLGWFFHQGEIPHFSPQLVYPQWWNTKQQNNFPWWFARVEKYFDQSLFFNVTSSLMFSKIIFFNAELLKIFNVVRTTQMLLVVSSKMFNVIVEIQQQ